MNRRGRPPHPDILTPREWEVLDLIRAGLTNDEIAARLGISLQGAKFHVSEILTKLQLPDRTAAARWQPPARRPANLVLAPLAFVLRKLVGIARWRSVQLVLAAGTALMLAVIVGAIVVATVFVLRSRHSDTGAGGLAIGEGVELPLLIEGDRLGVSSLSGADPDPVTGPGSYSDTRFDAAGRVAYVQLSGETPGFYRVENGEARRVIPLPPDVVPFRARWSPDASRAAWIEADGRLRIAEPDQSSMSGPANVSGFLWSPDSTRLMAWSADRGTVSIVDARDGTSTPTSAAVPESWSSAGDIASLDRSGAEDFSATLVLAHEDGTARRALGRVSIPPEGPLPTPGFSPDGRWLAWEKSDVGQPSRLMVADIRTGAEIAPVCPTCGASSTGGGVVWSPDGGSLAWSQDGHVVIAHTGEWSGAIVADGRPISWSPDGAAIAYVRAAPDLTSSIVYSRRLEGGDEGMVVTLTDARDLAGEMAWSPDGKQIVVPLQAGESSRVYGFDPATGDLRTFAMDAPDTAPAFLSPDGAAIYDRGFELVRSLDGPSSHATGGGEVTDWSRNGKRMLVVGQGLNELDLATGVRTQLLDGNVQDAVWSPDERFVAFVRDQRLGVLDRSSGNSRVIAPDLTAMYLANYLGGGYLAWSRDGKRIAFADWRGQDQAAIYLVNPDGSHLTRLTDSPGGKRYFAFAPDGHHLAYVNLRIPGTEIIDTQTKGVTASPSIDGGWFVWVGSNSLLSDTPQGIALFSLGGSSRLLVQNTGGCSRRLVGWTGSEIVFSSRCSHKGL